MIVCCSFHSVAFDFNFWLNTEIIITSMPVAYHAAAKHELEVDRGVVMRYNL